MTKTYAIIETNSGFVWGVVQSTSAHQACYDVDQQAGCERPEAGDYQPEDEVGARYAADGAYDVRIAPEGFTVTDGTDPEAVAAVEAMPRAGQFTWVPA